MPTTEKKVALADLKNNMNMLNASLEAHETTVCVKYMILTLS